MTNVIVPAGAQEASIQIKVIRADGTVEELGTVSYWHRNPFKRAAYYVKRAIKQRIEKHGSSRPERRPG